MALSVKDLLHLKQMKKMELIAGEKGLDNIVVTSNIADYEFAPGIAPDNHLVFEAHSFVVSSLLYAKDDPGLILSSIKELFDYNVSAFAFKDVIFKELPPDVIDFANENDFPIFKFSTGTFFENVIFEIMDAMQHDDSHYLSEGNLDLMINQEMTQDEVYGISQGLSLSFRDKAVAAYVKNLPGAGPIDIERLLRLFLTAKGIRNKSIIASYDHGLFVLMTGQYDERSRYEVMLKEILDFLSIDESAVSISFSDIHDPHAQLDRCFMESYLCYEASMAASTDYRHFHEIGLYQLTLRLKNNRIFDEYIGRQLEILRSYPELLATITIWIKHQGYLNEAASELNCHFNTVRYRLSQVRKLLHCESASEHEFYALLSPLAHHLLTMRG